ncbi:MAG: hydroxymethylbilane synthase, partial [Bacteroidetes bacterium]|nr:hydroxymethylbilane synthase [Bacteroidota bacterium]
DKILNEALSNIGDQSLFTKELEEELLNNKIDIAVHSLKDLETTLPKGLKLAVVTKRHPAEDVLIAKKKGTTLASLPENAIVATGSLRRKSQLLHLRPDLKIVGLRGNVPTRIDKFLKSNWDAIILARAGVERLNLKKHISSIIKNYEIVPAVGQGALGIEINKKNKRAAKLIKPLHDDKTYIEITSERAFLKSLGGGCQVPVGAYAVIKSNGLYLSGIVASLDGRTTYSKSVRGKKSDAEKIGKSLAKDILKAGAKIILNDIYNR